MNRNGMEKPVLRHVDTFPVKLENSETGIVLQDPLQIAPNPIVLTVGALLILEKLDGDHTLEDIQGAMLKNTGYFPPMDQIEALIRKLDEELYLEGPAFDTAYQQVREQFLSRPIRPSILAGTALPEDTDELRHLLDGFFVGDDGPGMPDPGTAGHSLKAVVAPHIDLYRGGHSFALSYKALAEQSDADVFVILGVAHFGNGHPFMVTDKDFDTPLGVVPAEKDMVARLKELAPPESLGDEFVHKREHSIEFQTVFLRYLYPDRDISIVPILCGSMHESLMTGIAPMEEEAVRGFLAGLNTVIQESGRRVCLIAGVDLAHVGPRFGDSFAVEEPVLESIEEQDRMLLDMIATRRPDDVFAHFQQDRNKRNVCGSSALYALLVLMDIAGETATGRLLHYEQSVEKETQSVVTFASMVFP